MIQLSYQPAYDPYNTIFRLVCLLHALSLEDMRETQVRILDFYLVFPHFIKNIRPTKKMLSLHRKLLKNSIEPYEHMPEPKSIYNNMRATHDNALQTLCLQGIVDSDAYTKGKIVLCESEIPTIILEQAKIRISQSADLFQFLKVLVEDTVFDGANGFKARTNLEEYKYDTI